jgi:Protein of unknown function (DUF2950)
LFFFPLEKLNELLKHRDYAQIPSLSAMALLTSVTEPKRCNEDWPFPVPLVKKGDKWSFDAKAGRQELLYRRIGANELDAIQVCRGYVEAQYDYAFEKRDGYDVNQYAQHIISTSGKQDGLAPTDHPALCNSAVMRR